jgi:hypothetical protein
MPSHHRNPFIRLSLVDGAENIVSFFRTILRKVETMRRTNIYLGDIQYKLLKAMAKKTGFKVSEIIRRMIEEGLEKHGKKV